MHKNDDRKCVLTSATHCSCGKQQLVSMAAAVLDHARIHGFTHPVDYEQTLYTSSIDEELFREYNGFQTRKISAKSRDRECGEEDRPATSSYRDVGSGDASADLFTRLPQEVAAKILLNLSDSDLVSAAWYDYTCAPPCPWVGDALAPCTFS